MGSDRQWKKRTQGIGEEGFTSPLPLLDPSSAEERDGNSKRVLLISMEIQSFTPPFVPPSLSFPNLNYSFSLSLSPSLVGCCIAEVSGCPCERKKNKQTQRRSREWSHVMFFFIRFFSSSFSCKVSIVFMTHTHTKGGSSVCRCSRKFREKVSDLI